MRSSSGVDNSPEPDPAPTAVAAGSAYDSAPVDEDVLCPLCYYNLRGAAESRCAECGYRFEWRDLRDPERRRHSYLFEHHPRHNLWSFVRTFKGALRPRMFWRELRPGQPSNVRRLVVYWFVTNLFALALPLAMVGMDMARYAIYNQQSRAWRATAPQAWLDAVFPLPPSVTFFTSYFSTQRRTLSIPLTVAAMYMAWPWLTFLALNVFQISMLRARISASHVLRCVVYTFDAMAIQCWLLLFAAGLMIAGSELLLGTQYWTWIGNFMIGWVLMSVALFIYRLTVAYRLYLQFHRPFLTVFASQVIVGLAVFTAVLWLAMYNPF